MECIGCLFPYSMLYSSIVGHCNPGHARDSLSPSQSRGACEIISPRSVDPPNFLQRLSAPREHSRSEVFMAIGFGDEL